MKNTFLTTLLLLPLCGHALTSDKDLPIDLISKTVNFNNNKGITVFLEGVKMDQGTTHLRADKVTVYKNSDGEIQKIIAVGEPAHYSTLPDNEDLVMDAFGNTIEYYPLERRAVILRNGLIQQGKNTFNADHLVYDMAQETIISIPTANGQKAKLVLQPKEMPGTKKKK